jgi:hypothetical protein
MTTDQNALDAARQDKQDYERHLAAELVGCELPRRREDARRF